MSSTVFDPLFRGIRGSFPALAVGGAAVVLLSTAAPLARATTAANLSLDVSFSATGLISVTLPDGTPVGTTSGTPTVIPAGFYTLALSAPGGCTELPYFDLKGPGNNVLDNMDDGELTNNTDNADFLPNSTYTWRNDSIPGVTYTFSTSNQVLGTAPAQLGSATGISSGSKATTHSSDLVGSSVVPLRGRLTATVEPTGRLTLAYRGKSVTGLEPGRYTIVVNDRSATGGFVLKKPRHAAVSLTGAAFVGRRSATVDLTAGNWSFLSRLAAKSSYSVAVT